MPTLKLSWRRISSTSRVCMVSCAACSFLTSFKGCALEILRVNKCACCGKLPEPSLVDIELDMREVPATSRAILRLDRRWLDRSKRLSGRIRAHLDSSHETSQQRRGRCGGAPALLSEPKDQALLNTQMKGTSGRTRPDLSCLHKSITANLAIWFRLVEAKERNAAPWNNQIFLPHAQSASKAGTRISGSRYPH